jgi:hypothetical protein
VRDEINSGAVTEDNYKALERLVGRQQLGLIASAQLLDWRADQQHLGKPDSADYGAAARLSEVLLERQP